MNLLSWRKKKTNQAVVLVVERPPFPPALKTVEPSEELVIEPQETITIQEDVIETKPAPTLTPTPTATPEPALPEIGERLASFPEPYEPFIHIVKPGDTFFSIAEEFDGISVDDILEANNVGDKFDPGRIWPGQKFIIPVDRQQVIEAQIVAAQVAQAEAQVEAERLAEADRLAAEQEAIRQAEETARAAAEAEAVAGPTPTPTSEPEEIDPDKIEITGGKVEVKIGPRIFSDPDLRIVNLDGTWTPVVQEMEAGVEIAGVSIPIDIKVLTNINPDGAFQLDKPPPGWRLGFIDRWFGITDLKAFVWISPGGQVKQVKAFVFKNPAPPGGYDAQGFMVVPNAFDLAAFAPALEEHGFNLILPPGCPPAYLAIVNYKIDVDGMVVGFD